MIPRRSEDCDDCKYDPLKEKLLGIIAYLQSYKVLASPWYHCIFASSSPRFSLVSLHICNPQGVLSSPWYHAYLQSSQSSLLLGSLHICNPPVLSSPWYHHICNPPSPRFSLVSLHICILPSPLFSLVSCIFAMIKEKRGLVMIANMMIPQEEERIVRIIIFAILKSSLLLGIMHICNPPSPLFSLVSSYLQSSQSSLLLGIMIFAIISVLSSPW